MPQNGQIADRDIGITTGGDIINSIEEFRKRRKRRLLERMKSEPDVHEAARLAKIIYIEYFIKPREKQFEQNNCENPGSELTFENQRGKMKLQDNSYQNTFKSLDYKSLEFLAYIFGTSIESIISTPMETLKELCKLICDEIGVNCDADDDVSWITTENGVHIPLNGEGKAVGGPLEGENFGSAKSEESSESGISKSITINDFKPIYEKGYDFNRLC